MYTDYLLKVLPQGKVLNVKLLNVQCLLTHSASEYHNRTISKLFGGNPYYGCYALAVTIFTIGIIRDTLYVHVLKKQDSSPKY